MRTCTHQLVPVCKTAARIHITWVVYKTLSGKFRSKWCQTSSATRHLAETKASPPGGRQGGGKAIHPKPQRIPTGNFSVVMMTIQAKISKHTRADR